MDTLDVGETEVVTTAWWDENGDPAEPSTIDLTITKPDGSVIAKTKADMTQGATVDIWIYRQVADAVGVWQVRAVANVGSDEITQSTLFLAGETPFGVAPCEPWCTWADVEALCPAVDFDALTQPTRAHLLDVATGILWSLDGRRYPGICTTTRRICRGCVRCVTPLCGCAPRNTLDLGSRWPAWGILEVTIDGTVLDPSAYALRDQRYVDRIDGISWPFCARLDDPDAFTITWALGLRPPVELTEAAAVFVAEMAKSCIGTKCEIPQRVTVISREGTTYTILDSQKFLDEGRTGIYRVDLALAAAKAGRKIRPGGRAPYRPGQRTSRV